MARTMRCPHVRLSCEKLAYNKLIVFCNTRTCGFWKPYDFDDDMVMITTSLTRTMAKKIGTQITGKRRAERRL